MLMEAVSLPFGKTYCFSTTKKKGIGQSETTVNYTTANPDESSSQSAL